MRQLLLWVPYHSFYVCMYVCMYGREGGVRRKGQVRLNGRETAGIVVARRAKEGGSGNGRSWAIYPFILGGLTPIGGLVRLCDVKRQIDWFRKLSHVVRR